jgi:hypothetical protein
MIKLKSLLLAEARAEHKIYSWQKPDGQFVSVRKSHGEDARNITKDTGDAIMQLWKRGWMRITFNGTYLMAHNEV